MPCRDGGPDISYVSDNKRKLDMVEAILCGVLTVVKDQQHIGEIFSTNPEENVGAIFDNVDWAEAGVTRHEAEEWWTEHRRQDEERRVREAAEELERTQRKDALDKLALAGLSDRDLELLGIKPKKL